MTATVKTDIELFLRGPIHHVPQTNAYQTMKRLVSYRDYGPIQQAHNQLWRSVGNVVWEQTAQLIQLDIPAQQR